MNQSIATLFRLRQSFAETRRHGIMPPHHPVGFSLFFCAIPTVSPLARLHHGLFYAASPCGEAPEFALPARQACSPKSSRASARLTITSSLGIRPSSFRIRPRAERSCGMALILHASRRRAQSMSPRRAKELRQGKRAFRRAKLRASPHGEAAHGSPGLSEQRERNPGE